MAYWYDGTLFTGDRLDLSIQDPALLYGATVFTTLRVFEGSLDHRLTAWEAHIARLTQSVAELGWIAPDWRRIRMGAASLGFHYPVLRVTLLPDGRELITGRSLPAHLRDRQTEGITLWLAEDPQYRRPLPAHKTGNYLGCWLALQAAQRYGAQEAVLVDAAGNWLETSTGNLWGWHAGQWWTPPLSAGILPGVARSRLLRNLQAEGETVMQEPWTPQCVQQFTALAYSNSVVEIVPIRRILRFATPVDYNPDHGCLSTLWKAWLSKDG